MCDAENGGGEDQRVQRQADAELAVGEQYPAASDPRRRDDVPPSDGDAAEDGWIGEARRRGLLGAPKTEEGPAASFDGDVDGSWRRVVIERDERG